MTNQFALSAVAAMSRNLPISSGLTAIAFNHFTNFLFREAPATLPARLKDGNYIDVSPHDHDGRILYLFGTNDPKVGTLANALLAPGEVFLDIGGNHCSIGLLASHAVGPEGAVHLFEPQLSLCERVRKAIQAGRYENVHLHCIGLMERDTQLELRQASSHSGMASFEPQHPLEEFSRTELCEVRNIATYVPPLVKDRTFGVKLDIEGAELHILPWLVAQPNLNFLIFEASHNRSELLRLAREGGLDIYGLRRHPWKFEVEHVDDRAEEFPFHDAVGIRMPPGVTPPKRCSSRRLGQIIRSGSSVS